MMKNNNSYKLPLALVFSLFFLWAISSNLLPTMLKEYWAYLMHVNEQMYHLAYVVPMVCFLFCAYYGWRGYKVLD